MEDELKAVIHHLTENRWPFRLHATYDETIGRALAVFEEVNLVRARAAFQPSGSSSS